MTIELLTAPDIGRTLGVKRAQAHRLTRRSDFPRPYAITPAGLRLWRDADVQRWDKQTERKLGRPFDRPVN